MSFQTTAVRAGLCLFAMVTVVRAQAPASSPTQAQLSTQTAAPTGTDPSSLLTAANAGNAQAQFALGNYYFGNRYVTLDYADAVSWYRKSAAQGYAPAQDQLGNMSENNLGLPQDYKSAANYYRQAANQGYAQAEYHLASMYRVGYPYVHRNYKQAFSWYKKAADQNLADAEEEVGYFYQSGWAVKRDYAQAIAWYSRSANHGNSNAENQLGYMAEEGWGQPQNYTVALAWFSKAAEHGSGPAQENMGFIYQHGAPGVPVDYAKAMALFVQATAQGDGDAENQLGWMYQYGQGVKADDSEALAWYQLSANQGNVNGQSNVADFTLDLQEDGDYGNATLAVHDPALEQAQRWANIQNLHCQIDRVEGDAQYQEDLAAQLEGMGKGKNDGISKIFKAMGSAGATKYHDQAANDRAQAASLRDQLAGVVNQSQSASATPMP